MMTIEQLRKDYDSNHVLYTDFLKEISDQLKIILESHDMMKMAEISKRVKEFDSIEQNINNYKFNPKIPEIPERLGLITDLAGIRITLLFKRYIEPICASIEKSFEKIDKKHIFHEDDQFGYKSVHYEVKLKRDYCAANIFDKFGDLIAEIQVRTLAQHLWAAASHYMNHKERKDVGKDLQRPLNRMSALLELIDEEYDRLLILKEEYQKKADLMDSVALDIDLLFKILKEEFPANKGFDLNENLNIILEDLSNFGIKTVKDFRELLGKNKVILLESQGIVSEIMNKNVLDKMVPIHKETVLTVVSDDKTAPEHRETVIKIVTDHLEIPMTFSIRGVIHRMLKLEFGNEDGFKFFEKIVGCQMELWKNSFQLWKKRKMKNKAKYGVRKASIICKKQLQNPAQTHIVRRY